MLNSANNLKWNATTLNGSDQTIDDYRLVTSADDLQNINFSRWTKDTQLDPSEGYIHGNYMLGNDIDLMDFANFKPLGYNMAFTDFKSNSDLLNFNGLNFTISNLTSKWPTVWGEESTVQNAGLFSVFSGTIKNLRLQDVYVSGSKSAGALIGSIVQYGSRGKEGYDENWNWSINWLDTDDNGDSLIDTLHLSSTIKNVSLSGENNSIEADEGYSGGLVGSVGYADSILYQADEMELPISNSETGEKYTVTIPYNEYKNWQYEYEGSSFSIDIGGVNYYLDLSTDYAVYIVPGFPKVTFENVENFSGVDSYLHGGNYAAGGILGVGRGALSFANSINKSPVTAGSYGSAGGFLGKTIIQTGSFYAEPTEDYRTSTFNKLANLGNMSANYAGGIFGSNNASESILEIKQSWNEGTIEGSYAGGIAGDTGYSIDKIEVDQVFNSGDITGDKFTGGLFGYWGNVNSDYTNPVATLTNSYNTGNIDGQNLSNSNVGGIIGQISNTAVKVSNVYNTGDVSNGQSTGGLFGLFSGNELKNSYNLGKVVGYGDPYNSPMTGGIVGSWTSGTISNVFNTGDVSKGLYVGGLIGNSSDSKKTLENAYNLGDVSSSRSGALIGGIIGRVYSKNYKITVNNAYTTQSDLELFGSIANSKYTSTTNVEKVDEDDTNISNIYENVFSTWAIDKDGTDATAVWRRYEDPNDKYNFNRQPLLAAFMNDAVIQRYNELHAAGKVTVADLVTIDNPNMNILHNSSGEITDVRYRNNGKSSVYTNSGTRYYDVVDSDFVQYDIVSSSDNENFAVNSTTPFAEALMWSSQFGYNFKADEDSNTDWQANENEDIADAGTNPADNAIYLMLGEKNNIPDPTPPVDIGKKPARGC